MKRVCIVPVKSLEKAKGRLAAVLNELQRRALQLAMLKDVLHAVRQSRLFAETYLVTANASALDSMQKWPGLYLLREPSPEWGLNGAVRWSLSYAQYKGAQAALVIHADLPLVTSATLSEFVGEASGEPEVLLAASHDGGTNAMYLCPPDAVTPQFGVGSLGLHLKEAMLREVRARVVESPELAQDIDVWIDVLRVQGLLREGHTFQWLQEHLSAEGTTPGATIGAHTRRQR